MIRIGEDLLIPERELRFTAARSSGPGGQNVNKVSTRVTLLFDLSATRALPEELKKRVQERFPTRINKEGVFRVVCQRYRSQAKNREAALVRFIELMEEALKEQEARIKTRIPAAAKRRRRDEKLRRSRLKRLRSSEVSMDE